MSSDLCVSLRNVRLFSSSLVTIKNSIVGVRELDVRVSDWTCMDSTMEVAAAFKDAAETQ